MLRFSSTALTQLPTDALIVDVDCVGGEPTAALRRCSAAFSDVADAYERHFNAGDLRPGELLVLPPTPDRSATVFLAPSRVHPQGELRAEDFKRLAKTILEETLRRGFHSLAWLPFHVGRGLDETEIRRQLLYSFARSPELELIYLSENCDSDPVGRVSIFTDGGAEKEGGKGGYGVVLRFGDHHKEISCGFQQTTVERMELMAAVVGLEALKRPCRVRLHSDSRYVVDTVNTGLLFRHASRQWKGKKSRSMDLWERFLDQYLKHDVEVIWIKGHSGIEDNDRCDQLAGEARQAISLAIDEGFRSKQAKRKSKPASQAAPATPVNSSPPNPTTPGPATTNVTAPANVMSGGKPKKAGDPCRACGHALEKRIPKKHKANAAYHFAWYLYCTHCKRFYHVEEAKVDVAESYKTR
ncbi:Ribonuclease HI [Stieleria neptunia]|uniref:ribonuclease H n=1 Tax=Stieleria neptunia TaxID=2527979 RepID=A0A518HIR2_9BACT|nr:RNase H family protein [Stieleria neptunia]QDV40722.1 Ribonuclease HI [Stieleria neptunia]